MSNRSNVAEARFRSICTAVVAGYDFSATIVQSSYPSAFAIHRMFPLDVNGNFILGASGSAAVPEPTSGSFIAIGIGLALSRRLLRLLRPRLLGLR